MPCIFDSHWIDLAGLLTGRKTLNHAQIRQQPLLIPPLGCAPRYDYPTPRYDYPTPQGTPCGAAQQDPTQPM